MSDLDKSYGQDQGKGKDEPTGEGGGEKAEEHGPGQVAVYHVFLRDCEGVLSRFDLCPAPTVQQFIYHVVEELLLGGDMDDEVFGYPDHLVLSTVAGSILPMGSRLDEVVATGDTVVINQLS